MTVGDLVLGIIIIAIFIEAFINIRKLGFEKYSIDRGLGYWMFFGGKLALTTLIIAYFLSKIDWSYKIF